MQEFTQRGLEGAKHKKVLEEALGWLSAGFVGNPLDVRNWATLDPLAPHALALARRADEAGIPKPAARLMIRRALAIDEARHGPDHPSVATALNNLAALLQATNRLAEAEPLYRRVLAIFEASYGPDHPDVATALNNPAELLRATNRLAEAEPMYRRALTITEASYGPDHPNVAIHLNNLAELLKATNRFAEAEPLMRRALTIFSRSFGWDHPSTVTVQENLTGLLVAMGRRRPKARAAIEALARALGLKL